MHKDSPYLLDIVAYFAKLHGLTTREREIVYCLARHGYSNRKLAEALCITEKTVKNHIAKIQDKTKAGSTRELLAMVVEQFIVHNRLLTDKEMAVAL
jgi:DNA-binding CsgD family transcriptional regulator